MIVLDIMQQHPTAKVMVISDTNIVAEPINANNLFYNVQEVKTASNNVIEVVALSDEALVRLTLASKKQIKQDNISDLIDILCDIFGHLEIQQFKHGA